MKRRFITPIILLTGLFIINGCTSSSSTASEETADSTEMVSENPGIKVSKAPASPVYEDASLKLTTADIQEGDSLFKVNFNFNVENYELGIQTEGADTRGIANSAKGQHIHFIVDNGPYSAHYEPSFSKEMPAGSYAVLAFLSRSYHESVKNDQSFFLDIVTVGDAEPLDIDFNAPHLFYSRPKGTYSGADTEKLMIDFFLMNTTLAPNGNKVRATVNGQEFLIEEWAPYYVEGLPKGDVNIKLELIDVNGEVIPGPFNVVERTVTLEE